VPIRPRSERDVPALVELADAVRAVDRWPPHRVGTTEEFVVEPLPVAALVAESDHAVIGHVAIHERSAESVMALAEDALRLEREQLAVVARLFVDPRLRRRGVGGALLAAAAERVSAIERIAILDVWEELDDAIGLYERNRWSRLGSVTFAFREACSAGCLHAGSSLRSYVYAAPEVVLA
jgi:GNAT superfamily N-acetyltransferase